METKARRNYRMYGIFNEYGTTVTIMYYENVKRLYQIGARSMRQK